METTKDIGNRAESIACEFFIKKGFKILEKNFRFGKNEIDIIAQDEKFIIFIEVKSKKTGSMTNPEAALNQLKQNKIFKVANYYVLAKNVRGKDFRFDVIIINFSEDGYKIEHFPDAFTYSF